MLSLHIPGDAVGCKVSARDLLMDEWKSRSRHNAGDVQIASRPVNDIAATIVCRDNLLWVIAERIGIKRQGVIENTDATTNDSSVIRAGRPSKPGARRESIRVSEGLSLPPQPRVESNTRIENPMVLR